MEIYRATEVTDELIAAFAHLTPQLSSSAAVPGRIEIQEMVSSDSSNIFIARDEAGGGQIVGTLTLVVFRIPTGVRAWIEDVVVDQNCRGKGVGELLTRAALDYAAQKGSRTVDLTSRPSREAANRLYQRVGFVLRESNLYRYNLK